MSTDPTRPMSPPAPAGAGGPEQPGPREHDSARPGAVSGQGAAGQGAAGGPADRPAAGPPDTAQPPAAGRPDTAHPPAAAPTRAQPTVQPAAPTRAQPTFQPAQPTFQPARPPQPPFQPPQPPFQPPRPGQPAHPPAGAAGWPEGPGLAPEPGGTRRGAGGSNAYPGYPGVPAPRRRRRRRWTMALFALIVLLILLVIGDRVALAVTENAMADQFVSNGLPVKPSVTIEGIPFLTQLAARDFRKVDISASNIPAGPVTITSARGTLTGMHLNSSFNGATVDHVSLTLFTAFSALADAAGLGNGTGITMTPDGTDKLKITASIAGNSIDTEEAQISQTGPRQISVRLLDNGSPLSGLLGSFADFSFSLPQGVPASLRITGLSLNAQGLTVTAAADHATFSK
ncbi:MAG TPA: LmeA family phospholipid-binding protein [Trebonia sp.]|jgi:hypothetical protein|nr:LmeA family phospholipid-binding protein [Trebonia sp.]